MPFRVRLLAVVLAVMHPACPTDTAVEQDADVRVCPSASIDPFTACALIQHCLTGCGAVTTFVRQCSEVGAPSIGSCAWPTDDAWRTYECDYHFKPHWLNYCDAIGDEGRAQITSCMEGYAEFFEAMEPPAEPGPGCVDAAPTSN